MQLKLDLSSFKSSGVYTLEVDNSIQQIVEVESLRLVPGFSEKPPFNRPIFLNSIEDKRKIYGSSIDTKLERKGCFYERSLDILLQNGPCIAINLLKTDDNDKVGFTSFSLSANDKETIDATTTAPYTEFFDRSRFWTLSTANLNQVVASKVVGNVPSDIISRMNETRIFNIVNTGTSDVTVFVIKDVNVTGYNITAEKWYENQELPYAWMNKTDIMSDYFVKLVVIKGDWTNFEKLSTDITWSRYFDNNGLKVSEVNKFLNATGVTAIGSWSGCIIPNFYNKAGDLVSIDALVNSYAVQTGVMVSLNEAAFESLTNVDGTQCHDGETLDASYKIDMVGNFITSDMNDVKMLSYSSISGSDIISNVEITEANNNTFIVPVTETDKYLQNLTIGTLIEGANGLTRISKKSYNMDDDTYTFTCNDAVNVLTDIVKLPCTIAEDSTISYNIGSVPVNVTRDELIGDSINGCECIDIIDGFIILEDANKKYVRVHKHLQSAFTHITPVKLQGLMLSNRHRPGFDVNGNVSLESGIEKIYSVLNDEGILRGLKNKEMISFRYIIDTMSGGLGAGLAGKKHLANLAKSVGKCTALINFPSVTEMTMSTDPLFCSADLQNSISKQFDTKYIPTGGNQDAHCSDPLTLPTKEEGADYVGIFSPFLKYRTGNRTILIPPAAHVANTFNTKYMGGDPYATIANLNGIISDSAVVGLEYLYDDQDRDNLEPFGVNPIISQNGRTMIYGDRTAYQEVLSDLNYLHVRELLNTIELECQAVLKNYVFKANNSLIRAEIVRKLNPILEEKLVSGALYSYNITCDETNNTPEIIDRAFGVVDITVQVTKNMEKIVQRIIIENLSE